MTQYIGSSTDEAPPPEEGEAENAASVVAPGKKRPRRYGRRLEDTQQSSIWIISFTDIMALMLTFFVLLYAMREPEKERFDEMSAALRSEFSLYRGARQNRGEQDTIDVGRINYNRALNLSYLQALMSRLIEGEPELERLEISAQSGRLVLSMPQDLMFSAGSAEVEEQGSKALFALGGALSRIKNRIEIVGHADPRRIEGEGTVFASNWELSLARAASVAAVLESVGYDRPLVVRGFSSAAYDDLPTAMAEEERLKISRRVDIVIHEDDGSRRQ